MPDPPLVQAAMRQDWKEGARLLRKGADPNVANNDGWTALHPACGHDHLPTAKLLHQHGASLVQWNNDGQTPLHFAARARFRRGTTVARWLLGHDEVRQYINHVNRYGDTALHDAALCGFTESV